MKFVIWGLGKYGKILFQIVGKENVMAIIESNNDYIGTFYNDVPVITLQEYKDKYLEYLIIISPKYHIQEIVEILELNQIRDYFVNENELIITFFLKINMEKALNNFFENKRVYIYGYTLFGILLYEYLQKLNYDCSFIIDTKDELRKLQKKNIVIQELKDLRENDGILFLTKPIHADAEKKFCGKIIEGYLSSLYEKLCYHEELEKFKNIHKNQRCFIVAIGPSLRMEDLDTLFQNKEICFSLNGIFKAYNETLWRPNYYFISDPGIALQYKEDVKRIKQDSECFVADWAYFYDSNFKDIFKWNLVVNSKDEELQFSNDFAKCSYAGGTIVYDGALQMAVYMGIKEIYLLGVDCNYNNPNGKYFSKDIHNTDQNHHEDKMIQAYKVAKKYADEHGIKIYNATRGGALEVFKRVDFDTLF